jgi:uncharacterized protein YndB with AHSA1/START domain
MTDMAENSKSSIVITHHFDAPVETIWAAWTDPAIVRRWWGSDPNGVVTSAELDVHVGGHFEISFRDSTGDLHTCHGTYLRVATKTELDFTWAWKAEPHTMSHVNVAFAAERAGTAMRFVHSELSGGSDHDYAQGWRRTFGKLDRALPHPL